MKSFLDFCPKFKDDLATALKEGREVFLFGPPAHPTKPARVEEKSDAGDMVLGLLIMIVGYGLLGFVALSVLVAVMRVAWG